jgi:hypothetical protein
VEPRQDEQDETNSQDLAGDTPEQLARDQSREAVDA